MRKFATLGIALTLLAGSAACSRNNIEAVNLANEGDKAKATDLESAISKYEQATILDPQNHRILWKLALAYSKKENWQGAVDACAKAEKLAPAHANYFLQHGVALARLAVKGPTAWSDARGPLEHAIQLDSNLSDAHFELAEVLLHLDDEQGALKEYTLAIEKKPDELAFYGPLADLYLRLNIVDPAEQALSQSLAFAREGDKFLFQVHSLLGQVADMKRELAKAVTEFETAKKICGQCNENGQQIAFFNLGAAYASLTPPRKSEAIAQLQSFQKMICKGAAAAKYSDQCSQAQQLASRLGGVLP